MAMRVSVSSTSSSSTVEGAAPRDYMDGRATSFGRHEDIQYARFGYILPRFRTFMIIKITVKYFLLHR